MHEVEPERADGGLGPQEEGVGNATSFEASCEAAWPSVGSTSTCSTRSCETSAGDGAAAGDTAPRQPPPALSARAAPGAAADRATRGGAGDPDAAEAVPRTPSGDCSPLASISHDRRAGALLPAGGCPLPTVVATQEGLAPVIEEAPRAPAAPAKELQEAAGAAAAPLRAGLRLEREPDIVGKEDAASQTPKHIKMMSEAVFSRAYKLGSVVAHSAHPGMSLFFARRLSDQLGVVVKVREKQASFGKSKEKETKWRSAMTALLNIPKSEAVCELGEVIETSRNYYVVMDRIEGQDLFETATKDYVGHAEAREIVRQVLVGLQVLHGAGLMHKDLKMENVMVSRGAAGGRGPTSVRARLIDFDTVESWQPDAPRALEVLGTDGYIAPEAYLCDFSPAVDIYCVGVIAYKLLTRRWPSPREFFDDEPGQNWAGSPAMQRIHQRLKDAEVNFRRQPLDTCPQAAGLCRGLLAFDPEERPSAEEALRHPWFSLPEGALPEGRRVPRK